MPQREARSYAVQPTGITLESVYEVGIIRLSA
jgi:hypothetical protein